MIEIIFQVVGAFFCGIYTVKLLDYSLRAHIREDEDKPWS